MITDLGLRADEIEYLEWLRRKTKNSRHWDDWDQGSAGIF